MLAIGGKMVLDGHLSIGELTAFVLYLTAFFAPIQQLVQLYTTYQSGQAAVVKLRDLLATRPTVEEQPDAYAAARHRRAHRARPGHVRLRRHAGAPRRRPCGSHRARPSPWSGETGAGKSHDRQARVPVLRPDRRAQILLDGHDLRDVTLASLRRQLGVVPQEPFLFAGTLRDNVAFARPDATDAEVLDACRAVGLDDLLDRLPDGIDSFVHERGTSLSSGERQLLALARAFLARPRVLVLDEATSNLDLKSESQIERALDAVLDGRTAILIAHRLATAMRADRIAVVHDGRIVELGTHDELVAPGRAVCGDVRHVAAHRVCGATRYARPSRSARRRLRAATRRH